MVKCNSCNKNKKKTNLSAKSAKDRDWNELNLVDGWHDVPVTEMGRQGELK